MYLARVSRAARRKLPNERQALVHEFRIAGHEGTLSIGTHADGEPGEVFIRMHKKGTAIRELLNAVSILTSLCLQHGVPLETLVAKFEGTRFDPAGITNNKRLGSATSVLDYAFRFLGDKYKTPPKET